ncbi:MAG TPA: polyphosphate kinase 2 family protein [Candidatus Omnitrophota bacterium]|nr:polyphosphate kinase 2 family protein [Candidatus Omnitrophota bacterium]HQL41848.1 polyphosphate kinase 2 family protein [Candidatus Omnitrophota bacterium]
MISKIKNFIQPYKITSGKNFRLKDFDPADTAHLRSKEQAEELLSQGIKRVRALQEKLYAQDQWSLLLIFQAMDAAGKDGAIKHVMSGVNPQGCQVFSFKEPSREELDHDFLWRTTCRLPERGRIGIFNRSYYEEVLTVCVHPKILQNQKLPKKLITKDIFGQRYESIRDLEKHLARNGTSVHKFFLNISKQEQHKRLLRRLDDPCRNWKFSMADLREREYWDAYMKAYEETIRKTATKNAPWYVVPANNKWFSRLVIAAAVIDALESLDLAFPQLNARQKKELLSAKRSLA